MPERAARRARFILNLYVSLFLLFLFFPLVVMAVPAFDASLRPSAFQWNGFTLQWFSALFADARLMRGLRDSVLVGAAVVALSLPLGLAGALVLHRLAARTSGLLFALLVSPILVPGILVGLSTLMFWRELGVPGGLVLAALAQTSYTASFAMMMFLARLDRFDPAQVEAALDLGASHALVMRRIVLPHLGPTAATTAAIAFLQSLGDYNTTVFAIGGEWTLITELGSRLRFGPTPVINAVAVLFVAVTLAAAALWVAVGRHAEGATRSSRGRI